MPSKVLAGRDGDLGLVTATRGADFNASTALREALAELQIIFDNAFVGVCYTRNRVVLRCNRRFEEMFAYAEGDLNGQGVKQLYPCVEDYERRGRVGYQHLKTHDSYSDERLMRRRDGSLFWCQVMGRSLDRANPEQDSIWIFQDITERKATAEALQRANEHLESRVKERTADLTHAYEVLREEIDNRRTAEQGLRESQEKYRALFETFPIGISITDEHGKVIEINRALSRLISLPDASKRAEGLRLESIEASLIRANGEPLGAAELPSVRAIAEGKMIPDEELGVRCDNGDVRWFQVTAAPIPVPGYGAMVAYSEITERKQIEERERTQRIELARVSRLNTMGEMAAALAHELGQPLAATLNYLHGCQLRLDEGKIDSALFESSISQAIYHAEQAGGIVRHVRQFVRKHDPESVPVNLNDLISQMLSFLEFERRQSQTTLNLELDPSLPQVWVDPLEFKQVMINLIKNAFEAMIDLTPDERIIEISTVDRQHEVEVIVSDRGPGVSKTKLTQIFNPFYSSKKNGIGLGLAVCRSIVESHGGRLSIKRNVHGGAAFSCILPVQAAKNSELES